MSTMTITVGESGNYAADVLLGTGAQITEWGNRSLVEDG